MKNIFLLCIRDLQYMLMVCNGAFGWIMIRRSNTWFDSSMIYLAWFPFTLLQKEAGIILDYVNFAVNPSYLND